MNFIVLHRWGKSERLGNTDALEPLLSELDTTEKDDEHVSVSVRLPSGWCISAFVSGLVVLENVEELTIAPRHLHVKTRIEARQLMSLLVHEKLKELEQQPWRVGNGVALVGDDAVN